MKRIWEWCRDNRHKPVGEQHKTLCAKLRGHYQYFGIRCNYRALEQVFELTRKAWRRWLGRRHRNGCLSAEKFEEITATFPLPLPRIIHNV